MTQEIIVYAEVFAGGKPREVLRIALIMSYRQAHPALPAQQAIETIGAGFDEMDRRYPEWLIHAPAMLASGLQPDWERITPLRYLESVQTMVLFSMEARMQRKSMRLDFGVTEPLAKLRNELAMLAHAAFPELGYGAAYTFVDGEIAAATERFPGFPDRAAGMWSWYERVKPNIELSTIESYLTTLFELSPIIPPAAGTAMVGRPPETELIQ